MPDPVNDHRRQPPYIQRSHYLSMALVGVIFFVFVLLRVQLAPGPDDEDVSALYDEICEALQGEQAIGTLFEQGRTLVRRGGTRMDLLFAFQFINAESGRTPAPGELEALELPVRGMLREGRFDDARETVQHEMLHTEAMSAGRAEIWFAFISEIERRWGNDCRLPAERSDSGAPPS